MYIGMIMTRAQSLRCLHLCGNPGLADVGEDGIDITLEQFLRKRIKGRQRVVMNNIPVFRDMAKDKYIGKKKELMSNKLAFKLLE